MNGDPMGRVCLVIDLWCKESHFIVLALCSNISRAYGIRQQAFQEHWGGNISAASIIDSIKRFQALPSALGEFSVEISDPWHFNESGGKVPLEGECGIYLYTQPGDSAWGMPLAENQNAVWYVGKSGGSIGGRVWSHMGTIYDPATGTPWTPRFKRHRWADTPSVPQDIRDRLAQGDVVVYAVAVRAETNNALLADLLEKHVLVEYVLTLGHLPPLNLQL